jgi:hypothetical protein
MTNNEDNGLKSNDGFDLKSNNLDTDIEQLEFLIQNKGEKEIQPVYGGTEGNEVIEWSEGSEFDWKYFLVFVSCIITFQLIVHLLLLPAAALSIGITAQGTVNTTLVVEGYGQLVFTCSPVLYASILTILLSAILSCYPYPIKGVKIFYISTIIYWLSIMITMLIIYTSAVYNSVGLIIMTCIPLFLYIMVVIVASIFSHLYLRVADDYI